MKTGTALALIGGGLAFIKQTFPDANAKLSYQASREQLFYQKERDSNLLRQNEDNLAYRLQENQAERLHREEQSRLDRIHKENEAFLEREHQKEMQKNEIQLRESELVVQREDIESKKYIANLNANTAIHNANLDREAQLSMHAKEMDQQLMMQARQLDHTEQLELRKLRVQKNLAKQNEDLQKYLFKQGIKSTQEIERFKALAIRETQILLARENAQNILQDRMVQEALKTFPLNISPLVLLRNRPHSLTSLLRFSVSNNDPSILPDVAKVYIDVKNYSFNPEALNIFIAPIHISSTIKNRDNLNQQIWDLIYLKVESFFTDFYNRRGDHPVILYPTAWKDNSVAGQHASETLHFFLKDMPCLVIEPRFDGYSLSMVLSGWNNGYLSSDHIRTQMSFDINLDATIMKSVYSRSIKSLEILEKLGDSINPELEEKKRRLKQNVDYYERLGIEEKIKNNTLDEVESLSIYDLFDIDFSQDLKSSADIIAAVLCINLAVLADAHHLQATDVLPIFTKLFKNNFPTLYEKKELREIISKCYEQVLVYLRNEDVRSVGSLNRREVERVRELQIENIKKDLELIDEIEIIDSIESQLFTYLKEKGESVNLTGDDLWKYSIERMTVTDIPFFQEILPNILDRRMFKRIDKKITELQRN